jgi:nucleotide-binding universal stress UspA family protein
VAIRDILLFLDDGKTNAQRIQAAICLAKQHKSNLTGVALGSMKPVHAPNDSDQANARMGEKMAQKLIEEFTQFALEHNLKVNTIIIFGDSFNSAQKMSHYARNFDLVLLSQPNPAHDNYNRLMDFAKQVLLHSGRPVFFMPYIGANKTPLQKAIVAWDGTPAVSRSLHDSIPILKKLDKVFILVVASKKQQHSKNEVLVDGLLNHLHNHCVKAEILRINPGMNTVATVIQNQISENDIDLLVIGGHGTPSLKQKIFGSVTEKLLTSMVVPVLMSD